MIHTRLDHTRRWADSPSKRRQDAKQRAAELRADIDAEIAKSLTPEGLTLEEKQFIRETCKPRVRR